MSSSELHVEDGACGLDLSSGDQKRVSTPMGAESSSDPGGGDDQGGNSSAEIQEESKEHFVHDLGRREVADGLGGGRELEMDVREEKDMAETGEVAAVAEVGAVKGNECLQEGVIIREEKQSDAADVAMGCSSADGQVRSNDGRQDIGDECGGDTKPEADVMEDGSEVGLDERMAVGAAEGVEAEGGPAEFAAVGDKSVLVEGNICCTEKKRDTGNDGMAGDVVGEYAKAMEGNLAARALVAGDGTCGYQKLEADFTGAQSTAGISEASSTAAVGVVEADGFVDKPNLGGEKVDVMETSTSTDLVEQGSVNDIMVHGLVEHLQADKDILDARGSGMVGVSHSDPNLEGNVLENTKEPAAATSGVVTETLVGMSDPGGAQVEVADSRKETQVTDEGISCSGKNQNMETDPRGQNFVDGHLQAVESVKDPRREEDYYGSGDDEKLEADVKGAGCSAIQATVAAVQVEAESFEGIPDLGVHDRAVEINNGAEPNVASVSFPEKDQSKLNEMTDQGLINVHLQAAQGIQGPGDSSENQVVVVENTARAKDVREGRSLNINEDTQPPTKTKATEVSEVIMVNGGQDGVDEAPVSQMLSVDSNQSSQGISSIAHGTELEKADHMLPEGAVDNQAAVDCFLDVPVKEAENRDMEIYNENSIDKGDNIPMTCPGVETQISTVDACTDDENLDKDLMMEDRNLALEVSVQETSELSEIRETISQPIGSLIDRSHHANADEGEPSAGSGKSMGMASEFVNDGDSPPVESGQEVELAENLIINQKISVVGDGVATAVLDASADDDQNVQDEEHELLKSTEKQSVKHVAVRPETYAKEIIEHASYYLPSQDKDSFTISDLVWGKVKSHPWWPGQIFDPSDASDLALKYQKKENFLVAYFGDKTFAWCDESQLKPFKTCFSQMEKQSSSDSFVNAVNCALGEVSRRIESGMTCCCIPEKTYVDIKHQKLENAGIRDGIGSSVSDRSLIVGDFQPDRLLLYINSLAQFPVGGANRLELVIAKAQLKAFYQSKGYSELPMFQVCGGLMENDAEILLCDTQKNEGDAIRDSNPTFSDVKFGRRKSRGRGSKQKPNVEDGEKQKSLSELMEEKDVSVAENGKSGVKTGRVESVSVSSGRKRKIIDSDSVNLGKSKKERLDSFGDLETKSSSPAFRSSFKVGECIRRVASQLTGSPPILKCYGETFQKNVPKAEHRNFDVFGTDMPSQGMVEKGRRKGSVSEDYPSPDELLSQLCLAARDPLKGYSFVSRIVSFFTRLRNFVTSSSSDEKKHVEKVKGKRGRKRKVDSQPASSEMSTPDHMQDSYWSDVLSHSSSSNGLKRQGEAHMRSQRKKRKSSGRASASLSSDSMFGTAHHLRVGTVSQTIRQVLTAERPIISVEEKIVDECTPTALILSFNGSKSLPSETDLIRIFSRYGPLKEAETEVQKKTNRVKVVFKKRADAEIAFSTAGKYSIFGPSLLSYRLVYLPSALQISPAPSSEDKDDAAPMEGGNLLVPSKLPSTPNPSTAATAPDKDDARPIEVGNTGVSANLPSTPDTSLVTMPEFELDAKTLEDDNLEVPHDLPSTHIPSAAAMPDDKIDARSVEIDNVEVPGNMPSTNNVDLGTMPLDKINTRPFEGDAIEDSGNLSSTRNTASDTMRASQLDGRPLEGGSTEVTSDLPSPHITLTAMPHDNIDARHVESGNLEDPGNLSSTHTTDPATMLVDKIGARTLECGDMGHPEVPVDLPSAAKTPSATSPEGKNISRPIEGDSLEVPRGLPSTTSTDQASMTQDENDITPTEGGDLDVSALPGTGVVSDRMQADVIGKESVE